MTRRNENVNNIYFYIIERGPKSSDKTKKHKI